MGGLYPITSIVVGEKKILGWGEQCGPAPVCDLSFLDTLFIKKMEKEKKKKKKTLITPINIILSSVPIN